MLRILKINQMRHSIFLSLIATLLLPLLPSCKGGNGSVFSESDTKSVELSYAHNLKLDEFDGFIRATVRNPWDTTKTLHTYLLIPDSADRPSDLPEGTVVRVPLKNALIYSTVHQSLIGELGAREAIGGICDAQYIHNPELLQLIADGKVADCGSSYTPNMERIIQLNPDAILLSPYENSGNYGKLGQMGIPLVECADYMEGSPLGRTEWMKFYGILFGTEARANGMFDNIEKEYKRLTALTDTVSYRPKVMIDRLYGNSWYVPSANSTMGRFIKDAGGSNPFDGAGNAGSIGMSGEQVLHEAGNADIWILRYGQATDKTLHELASDSPIYGQFKPLKDGRVYGCNTQKINYYEQTPFHPHWVLKDFISIIHPEISDPEYRNRYFTPLKP